VGAITFATELGVEQFDTTEDIYDLLEGSLLAAENQTNWAYIDINSSLLQQWEGETLYNWTLTLVGNATEFLEGTKTEQEPWYLAGFITAYYLLYIFPTDIITENCTVVLMSLNSATNENYSCTWFIEYQDLIERNYGFVDSGLLEPNEAGSLGFLNDSSIYCNVSDAYMVTAIDADAGFAWAYTMAAEAVYGDFVPEWCDESGKIENNFEDGSGFDVAVYLIYTGMGDCVVDTTTTTAGNTGGNGGSGSPLHRDTTNTTTTTTQTSWYNTGNNRYWLFGVITAIILVLITINLSTTKRPLPQTRRVRVTNQRS
jgi:hypothetical protein